MLETRSNFLRETLALRKAIEAAREPGQLVFHEIPKAFGFDPKSKTKLDAANLAKKLRAGISELQRCFPELQFRMAAAIVAAFKFDGSLQSWRDSISGSAENSSCRPWRSRFPRLLPQTYRHGYSRARMAGIARQLAHTLSSQPLEGSGRARLPRTYPRVR